MLCGLLHNINIRKLWIILLCGLKTRNINFWSERQVIHSSLYTLENSIQKITKIACVNPRSKSNVLACFQSFHYFIIFIRILKIMWSGVPMMGKVFRESMRNKKRATIRNIDGLRRPCHRYLDSRQYMCFIHLCASKYTVTELNLFRSVQ